MPQRRQYSCGDARRELPPCPPHLSCKLRPQCAEGTPGRPLHWVRTVQPALPARYRHSGGTAPHRWLCGTVEARHIMSRKMLNRPACCTDRDVRAYCGTEGKSALTGKRGVPTFTTCCLHNCNGSAGIDCRQVVERGLPPHGAGPSESGICRRDERTGLHAALQSGHCGILWATGTPPSATVRATDSVR